MAYVDIGGYSYSTGNYGAATYGSAEFLTTSSSSSATAVNGSRIRTSGSISASTTCTTSGLAEKVNLGVIAISVSASLSASGAISVKGSSAISVASSSSATCNRVQNADIGASVTSVIAAVAREKWEPIAAGAQNWVTI